MFLFMCVFVFGVFVFIFGEELLVLDIFKYILRIDVL